MTPRRFDPEIVERRLTDIRTCVERLEELGPFDAPALGDDWLVRSAAERLFVVLVEAAVKVNSHVAASALGRPPDDYRSSFAVAARAGALDPALAERLAPSAGLRNILVHGYDEVDTERLASGLADGVDLYPESVEQLATDARERRDT